LQSTLAALGAEVKVDEKGYKIKGKVMTSRGEISIVVVVYRMADSVHLIEAHKGRGDTLAYNSLYAQMREQLADLATKASAARMRP
jgi:hypothetical protein